MKTLMKATLTGLAVLAVMFGGGADALAQQGPVQSLRGETALEEGADAVDLYKPLIGDKFERNYRQQPPLIPHEIDQYQIDTGTNQCIACHDWPQNVGAGAPKISETHYRGREGERLNHVSTSRWFCTQCHVPQVEAEELVPNDFESAVDVE